MLVLLICRLVSMAPLPGLDGGALKEYFDSLPQNTDASILGMFNLFTGGALGRCAVGSLGIMPYISATIIIQLLSAVLPRLARLAREEGGRTKIVQYGRFLTVVLCLGQGYVMALTFENPGKIFSGFEGELVLFDNVWGYRILTAILLTAGTVLLMWLGEQITERGIGNGISLIITIGILSRLPLAYQGLKDMFLPPEGVEQQYTIIHAAGLLVTLIAVIAGVIAVTQAQRKIPVQYAQRSVGRKVYAGGSSFMPLRVNYAGVMPVIFAQAILMFPSYILNALGQTFDLVILQKMAGQLQYGSFYYLLLYSAMIMFFSYFWVATQFNEIQISDDLKKNGGYIPGVRPGQATTTFLHNTMSRITFAGAVFLTIIAVIPVIMATNLNISFNVSSFFGGTGVLIMVGVMLDTMRQMESHLLMRHYDGFLKKGRMRGRI